jgi:pSer/pThr/pTyr-binding forkhead associated (FHA) protein
MPKLDDLEARLQTLLEIQLLKYLPGYVVEDRVYQQLANAMQNSLREQGETIFAPNVYVIVAHPSMMTHWHSEPRILSDLAEAIKLAGEEKGFHFLSNPVVSTAEDSDSNGEKTRIISSFSHDVTTETRGMATNLQTVNIGMKIPPNAFLILDGNKIIPLDQPVLNVGRRINNQIVINDKRVSRTHAQLRVSKGKFALFDLNSSGGTFINGRRINQSTLFPGDVISLAGVKLIYGQDLPAGQGTQKVITTLKTGEIPVDSRNDDRHPGINRRKKFKEI